MKVILVLLLVLVIIFLSILFLPWVLIYVGNLFEKKPEKPLITYGEFPFRLEYEINGQSELIEDTLIVEYKGVGIDEGRGKYRKWESRLESGNEKIYLFQSDLIKIYYPEGSPEFYMGDLKDFISFNPIFPNAAIVESKKSGTTHSGIIREEELISKYKIKLISWEIAEPITNSFISK